MRLELHGRADIHRLFGAAVGADAVDGADAGGLVVVEAELVLPVAIGDPGIDHVGVFRTPDGLGEVECQTDRLGVDFDDSRGKIACSFMHY